MQYYLYDGSYEGFLTAVYYSYYSAVPDKIVAESSFEKDLFASSTLVKTDPIHQASSKVRREKHRMLGLIRFQQLNNGIYYSSIEPDHFILPLIASHFANRFSDQRWVIHDLKRNQMLLFDTTSWVIAHEAPLVELNFSEEETVFQKLWREYFDHISIKERKNLKLQRNFMPERYWKHLIEKHQ
ncbi:putative DNA metabolism protein [Desulfitispora alkaliphila]|uniref:TIGR03915 family putative DNA repair protein n=1 Tax=Desulfitispora alkaliphila TaxID=622674 RepID=UPI003D19361A